MAHESLNLLEAFEATSFPDVIVNSYPHLQTTRAFPDAASFDSDPTAQHASFPLTEEVRRVLDSMMIRMVDPLLKGPIGSFGGKLQLYHVLVHGTECTLLLRPTEFGTAHNVRLDFSRIHAWLEACFPPGLCRPPLLDHLLNLLLELPKDFDTSPTVREQYLLSVRNHMSLASFARQQTLLINYGKLIKCLDPSELGKLENAMTLREQSTGKGHAWRDFVEQVKLMRDVHTRADTGKQMVPFNKTDSLYDVSHFLRVFEVHAPQYVLDSNHHPVLMHFEQVHLMMQSYFKEDMAELYIALLPATTNPLVNSTCKCYENRG